MTFLVVIALLWYASERWSVFAVGLKVLMFVIGMTAAVIITKTGFTALVLQALWQASLDFVAGVFGLVKALLFE